MLVGAAHCGHDRSAVGYGADVGHAAHDLRLRAGEACAQGDGSAGQVIVQGRTHVFGGCEALHGVLRHGLEDDSLKGGVDLRVELARRHGLVLNLLHGDADRIGAVEGQLARGGLVQHDAERVDVAGGGELLALRLLGGDIVSGAQHVEFFARAMPKSMTFTLPSGCTMMFCGLMSR